MRRITGVDTGVASFAPIHTVPVAWPRLRPTGALRPMVKNSSPSATASSRMGTKIVRTVSPGWKLTAPDTAVKSLPAVAVPALLA